MYQYTCDSKYCATCSCWSGERKICDHFGARLEGYMQLAPKGCKDKWKEIGFHFEILWSRDFMINGIVKIEAHQEKTKGDNISQVFNILKITDVEYRGHNKPVDTGESISCNFATKDNAEDSFMKILSELERLRAKHEEWETIT